MAKYEAIAAFRDSEDKGRTYHKGDRYPFPANKKISAKRLKELSSSDNGLGYPVIKEVKDESGE
ncbi:hypothetical protein GJU40_01520 [Bacillus lacus]|uniref:Uncharacterized protein n=1 Tax=Metabacillus lacus TaxID=1983721 RepID=A0A7X2IW68_9BACI|nr:hypothetical protein [Metabacillus lacus]MRX70845.1 hypothetical protein [Metabacillus lacus]